MVSGCPEFAYIRIDQLVVSFTRTRSYKKGGLLAYLIPLRFQGGSTIDHVHGKLFEIPTMIMDGIIKLYIIGFLYPRFLDLLLEEKVKTIIHELYHISEDFDGDIRRFPGRTFAHSGRKTNFDKETNRIADTWLSKTGADLLVLSMDSKELSKNYGKVIGLHVSKPKIHRLP